MKLDKILWQIKQTNQRVLHTTDVMALLDIKKDHASKILSRLSQSGHLAKLKRGLWAFTETIDPLIISGYLTAPFPCYISLQSALYYHGMISQISSTIYCVSLARTRRYGTPAGAFSIHHISSDFFYGYDETESGVRMATPEKALLDFLYLSPGKTKLFCALPELELPRKFSVKRAKHMIAHLKSSQRKSMLESKFQKLLEKTAT